jgi:hypothetical protein
MLIGPLSAVATALVSPFVAGTATITLTIWGVVAVIAAVVGAIVVLLNDDLRNGVWRA